MLWSIRYRFRYQLHWMNILVCSLTAPVDMQKVYIPGLMKIGREFIWLSEKYFPLALCLCYEAKDIYLHVGPPTARYLTVEYRTRVKRQLQGLRCTFTKISWYFVRKTRAGDTLLLDRNYLRRRTLCFFQSSNMMSLKISDHLQLIILRQVCRQENPSNDHPPVNLGHSC